MARVMRVRSVLIWLSSLLTLGLSACASDCPPCAFGPLGGGKGLLALSQEYYVVRASPGDTYLSLAWEHNVSPYDVVALNHVEAPYRLRPGELVRIPAPRIHIVRRGDTLLDIARSYHVGFYDLAQANALNSPFTIYPGQVLRLPAGRPVFDSTPETKVFASAPSSPRGADQASPGPQDPEDSGRPKPRPKPPEIAGRQADEPSLPAAVTVASAAQAPHAAGDSARPKPRPKPPEIAGGEKGARSSPSEVTLAAAAPVPRVPEQAVRPKPRAKPPASTEAQAAEAKLIWPVKGRVISDFGPTSNGRHNDGINIAVPERTPVHAAADGVVIYRGNEVPGYGNLILIQHDGNLVTAYAHNSAFRVMKGDHVRQGQLIALSGSTGNVDEPQLHFEVREGVKAVYPKAHLKV